MPSQRLECDQNGMGLDGVIRPNNGNGHSLSIERRYKLVLFTPVMWRMVQVLHR